MGGRTNDGSAKKPLSPGKQIAIGCGVLALLLLVLVPVGVYLITRVAGGEDYTTRDIPAELERLVMESSGLDQPGAVNGWATMEEAFSIVDALHDAAIKEHRLGQNRPDMKLAADRLVGEPTDLDHPEQLVQAEVSVYAEQDQYEGQKSEYRSIEAAIDSMLSDRLEEVDRLMDEASQANGFAIVTSFPASMTNYDPIWNSSARDYVRLQHARWQVALDNNESQIAVTHLRRMTVPVRALSGQVALVERLTSIAIRAMLLEAVRSQALESDDPAILRELVEVVELADFQADMVHALECELRLGLGDVLDPMLLNVPMGSFITNLQAAKLDEGFQQAITWGTQPAFARTGQTPEQWADGLNAQLYALTSILMPALEKVIQSEDIATQQYSATVLLLAIRLHEIERGELPQSLDALVPDYLSAIPLDPFCATGFVYRPQPDPVTGAPFMLYSTGADGIDNRGVEDPEGYHRAFGPDGAGYDVNFTRVD